MAEAMESTQPEPVSSRGLRLSAVIEAVGLLVILLLVDGLLVHSHRYWNVNPHPFWIPVLLVAAQYGTKEALLTATLATIFLLAGNFPDTSGYASHYDWVYAICINPVLWFVFGWVVGELRQRHIRDRDQIARDLVNAKEREQVISDSYRFVRHRKEALEVQVSGQLNSSIEAYRAAKAVETLDPKSVLQGVERLVKSVLGPQKFSLYILHDSKLNATVLHGWNADDRFAQEIDSFSPLYQAIVGAQETLVVANEQHEQILHGQGLLAAPILEPDTRRVIGMLKVEQLEFTALSLNTVETLRALSDWIGMALINARNYQQVKTESVVNPERSVMTYNFFKRQSDYLSKLAKRVGFDLSMVVIRLNDPQSIGDQSRVMIARQINDSVRAALRDVDLAFDYQTDGEEYSILLPATSQAGAGIVRDKIAKDIERNLRGIEGASFNYIIQALHEAR